jgi:HAD superfamily hydrolase (TIGR01509 family)
MRIEAIAWDIDGTLVDSEPLHQESLRTVCLNWGADISDMSDELFRGMHMGDVWLLLKNRLPADLTEEVWGADIIDYYVARAHTLKPLPGAVEAVRLFAEHGIPQACVSNSGRRVVDANLDGLGIRPYLTFSISLDDVAHGKPDPEPYAEACRTFGLLPAQVLAAEDSLTGFSSAHAAGLATAFYTADGTGPAGADIVTSDLRELAGLVLSSTVPEAQPTS